MRVIVIGSGEVGQHISATLSGQGHDVTVIERDERRVAGLENQLDALVVAGNGASPRVLHDVGAADADLVLAVTESDEVNLLAAAAAHRLGTRRTLARVRDGDFSTSDPGFVREVLGVDALIDPEQATAADIAETLLVPGAVHVEYFGDDGAIALAEVSLDHGSPLVGSLVRDRPRSRPHAIVGVLRKGVAIVPTADERLEAGDHVFVAAARQDIAVVVAEVDDAAYEIRDAIILGGGKIGLHLARALEQQALGCTVIEAEPERARHLAEHLPQTLVLHEDELSQEVLLGHGIDQAGAFVACAGDDRTNLLAALYAKRLGARLCLAVVSREQYVPLVDALGIDAAFSLRLTTAEAILRHVRSDSVRSVHLTLSGAEVLDLHADPGAAIVGQSVASAGHLEGCEIAAITRDDAVIIPEEEERIQAGDRVLIFRLAGAAPRLERAFDA